MDLASLMNSLETGRIMQKLNQLNTQELIENPYLLGSIGALALLSLIMRWRLLLVSLMAITGFVWLVHYIQQRGTELNSLSSDSLLLFVGGGVVLIGLTMYFLFVKGE